MAGDSTSTVKSMNPHLLRFYVVKFDGKNNFGIWKCKVMNALTTLMFAQGLFTLVLMMTYL